MSDQEKMAEFIVAAGMLMAYADGNVDPVEWELLKGAISGLTDHPEKFLYFDDYDTHVKRTEKICAYFASSDEMTKGFLLGMILGIAMCDEKLHKNEKAFFFTLADMLKYPKEYTEMIMGFYE